MSQTGTAKQRISELQNLIRTKPNSRKIRAWRAEINDLQKQRAPNREYLTDKAKGIADSIVNIDISSQMRKDFIKCLVYPDQFTMRMPDDLTQPTVLYRSLREFALIANMDGTINAGKFSFAVKPILGQVGNVKHYQVGMVDASNGWPVDFTNTSSYVTQNLSSNPQADPMAMPLLSALPGQFRTITTVSGTIGNNATIGYGEFFSYGPTGISVDTVSESCNLDIPAVFSTTPLSIPGTPLLPGVLTVEYPTYFKIPAGVYNINPYLHITGTWATLNSPVLCVLSVNEAGVVDGSMYHHAGAVPDEYIGYFQVGETVHVLNDWNANLYNVNQSLVFDNNFNLVSDGKHSFVWFVALTPSTQSITNAISGLIIQSVADCVLPYTSDSGSVIKMRPIALSCLVTCTLPELTAGGNIIGYSAPPGDIDNYYYRTSSTLGPYQEWQNLARNNKGINTHDGNFKDGTYVWTQPWETNDTLMRTPSEMLNYPYQGIIVSGQVNPTVQLSGNVEIGRVRISILYEYTTDNRLFNGEPCYGTPNDLSWCLNYLATCQHAMENTIHIPSISKIVKDASQWVQKSIPTMRKGLDIASGVSKLLL
jgi:hypothetical protein